MKPHHAFRHGHASSVGRNPSSEYATWAAMIQRCTNPACKEYRNYGGRGITVCTRWTVFENFLADMGTRPAGMSLDRADNSDGYTPENCRWVSPKTQARNMRTTTMVTIDGVVKPLAEWCEISGVNKSTALKRIRRSGWSPVIAVTTPALWSR